MRFCIYEDTTVNNFRPLIFLRPVYDLRCGILTLREKIEHRLAGAPLVLHARPEIEPLLREDRSRKSLDNTAEDWTMFINGRSLADEELARLLRSAGRKEMAFVNGSNVVAAIVSPKNVKHIAPNADSAFPPDLFRDLPSRSIGTAVADYPWDLIHRNPHEILNDRLLVKSRTKRGGVVPRFTGVHLLNRKQIVLGKDVRLKPGVVIDAENGPVILGNRVQVMPNAVIQGPVAIGDDSIIKIGAKIYPGTTIGPRCKVGGEVEGTIIHSFSNKQHDGFLGHSYLASWVNLGADTNTSDLKNTYGPVSVMTEEGKMNTGQQFLGLIMGDHSKSGINVMFDTGTIVGVSCNIYGAGLPPKFLPSFSWGGGKEFQVYTLDKSLETARRVMARRDVALSPGYEQLCRDLFRSTGTLRTKAGIR
jgi:UDP-N-acetylglucosamine diphosphorylase/glucosamine-1-phosphate N-acetyltransferase